MHANGRHKATLNMEYVDRWAEGERYSHYVFILFISRRYHTEIILNLLVCLISWRCHIQITTRRWDIPNLHRVAQKPLATRSNTLNTEYQVTLFSTLCIFHGFP